MKKIKSENLDKEIELTVGELISLYEPLVEITSFDLDMKAKYRLVRCLNKVMSEKKVFEKLRLDLFKKHGVINSNGGFDIPPDDLEKVELVSRSVAELREAPVKILFYRVNLSSLLKDISGKDISINGFTLAKLQDIIVNDTDFLS